jgi:hypothetical protein
MPLGDKRYRNRSDILIGNSGSDALSLKDVGVRRKKCIVNKYAYHPQP